MGELRPHPFASSDRRLSGLFIGGDDSRLLDLNVSDRVWRVSALRGGPRA